MKLSEAALLLRNAGIDNARGEARILFREIGKIKESELYGGDPDSSSEELISAIERRRSREPLQYILGKCDFYNETYLVTPDCLIPRQDTECLVDYAVRNIPEGENFLDLCTGSGCVAVSTLKNTRTTTALAVDISPEALAVAKENAEKNGVADRLTLTELDVLTEEAEGEYFAILSNPPYVPERAYSALEPELYFEPRLALVGGGEDGCLFYERIVSVYKSKIKQGGFIALEIGYDQAERLCSLAREHGLRCEILPDLSGLDRVAVLKK